MTDWTSLNTTEKLDAIDQVYERKGETYTRLAEKLGTGRSAIAGMYNRHPELRKTHPVSGLRTRPQKPAEPREIKPRARLQIINVTPFVETMKRADVILANFGDKLYDATALRITLDQFTSHTCKWPVDGPDEIGLTYFCGHATDDGPWCAHHHARARGRGTDAERSAARVLKAGGML